MYITMIEQKASAQSAICRLVLRFHVWNIVIKDNGEPHRKKPWLHWMSHLNQLCRYNMPMGLLPDT